MTDEKFTFVEDVKEKKDSVPQRTKPDSAHGKRRKGSIPSRQPDAEGVGSNER